MSLKAELCREAYKPKPVKRVEIPKADGSKRNLGIPTVLDRFIQQAIAQVLQHHWDKEFHNHSYGFRPKYSAHQAIRYAKQMIQTGNNWVVDLDLKSFFDKVNHDRLVKRLQTRINDKVLLKLINRYLKVSVQIDGKKISSRKGVPQGGPLSPILSNMVLDELDWELERRGHTFVRYADDCSILVKSETAGRRVKSLQIQESPGLVGKPTSM